MKSTCFGKCSFRYPSEKRTADPGAERPIPSRQPGCQPMGRAAGSSNLPNSSMKSTCFGKCSFRYPREKRTADPGAERPIPSRQLGCQPMGRAAGSSNLPNSSKRKTTVRWTVVFLFLPRSGPNFSLRPKAALFPFPAGRAPSPPFSFCRKKRTGRWSGPRDKTPWAPRLNVLHEARMGPWTPISSVNRPAKASLI